MCCPFHRWQSAREDAFLIYVVKNNFASLCRLCNTERTCRRSASQSTEYHSTVHEGSIRGEKALFTLLFLHFQQVFRDSNQQFNSHLSRFSRVCSPSRRIFFIFFYTILTSASFSSVLSFVKSVQTSEPTLSHQTLFWLCHSFLFCPFFSKSIMHQCGIADLGLKQTLLLSFHGCTGGHGSERSLTPSKLSKGRGSGILNIHRCSPFGTSEFIQIHWRGVEDWGCFNRLPGIQ